MTKAIVLGACGRMGKLLVNGIAQADDLELVGAVEAAGVPDLGKDAGEVAGAGTLGVEIVDDSQLSELMIVQSLLPRRRKDTEKLRMYIFSRPMLLST